MPLIDPLLMAQARRHWQLLGAVAVLILFLFGQFVIFQPELRRYQAMVQRSGNQGLTPARPTRPMSPQVRDLLVSNSLPDAVAQQRGASGELAAELVNDITRLMDEHGMELLGTEPGIVTQQPKGAEVRAHLRVQCSYGELVAFCDALANSGKLISIDRMALTGGSPGRHELELWVTRYVLKRPAEQT
jgi:hypothetical protein